MLVIDQMQDKDLRTLKIKTGVVKRLAREKLSYKEESCQLEAKIEKMKSEGVDEYTVKKQQEVLQESLMMIPDCHKKLVPAIQDLQNLLRDMKDFSESEDYQTAESVLATAQDQLA